MSTTIPENESQDSLLDLNPMDLNDILVRTFSIYMKRPLLFFGIVAVIAGIPMAVFESSVFLFTHQDFSVYLQGGFSEEVSHNWKILLILFLAGLLINYFLQPVATGGIVQAIRMLLTGRKPGLKECLLAARENAKVIMYTRLLTGLIYLVALVCIIAILAANQFVLFGETHQTLGVIVGFILNTILYFSIFFFAVKFLLIPQIVVTEKLAALDAIRRSWRMTSGFWWKTMGLAFWVNFIILILSSVTDWLFSEFWGIFAMSNGIFHYTSLVIFIAILIFACLFLYPLSLISYTLLYFNIRVVREGFNLDSLDMPAVDDLKSSDGVTG
jgi:hypothetical protein